MDITFTLQSVTDGSFLIGQAANTTVYISKDGGSYAATNNSVSEIGRGSYKVTLTSTEASFTDMLLYQPVCSGAQTNTLAIEKPTDVSSLATSSDLSAVANNVSAVKAKTDNLPAEPAAKSDIPSVQTIQSGLATSSDLSSVATNVSAVKAKTDNLPAEPAAVGSAMTLTSATITSVKDGLATGSGLSSLASHGDTYWVTANVSGLATGGGLEALANYGDSHWSTANVSSLATADALSSVATTANAIKAKTDLLPAEPAAKSDIPSVQTIQSGLATSDSLSSAQTAIINRGNEAWKTAAGFATPTNITDAVSALEAYGDQHWQGGSGGVTPGGERPLYCTTAMLYAHWTQTKIDTWSNGSQTAIDNAIEWACNKIDSDLQNATSVPFQPVPASIRDLAILAAGARLADLAGASAEPDVKAAWAYYQEFVENYNYHVDNQQ